MAAAGAAGLAAALVGCGSSNSVEITPVEVDDENVTTLDAFQMIETPQEHYKVKTVATLDAGIVLHGSCESVAAALICGESASPLNAAGIFDFTSAQLFTLLDQAVGHEEGFSILDVRASSDLLVWTELNYLTGEWRVYCAELKLKAAKYTEFGWLLREARCKLKAAVLLDEGDEEFDPPELECSGGKAFWVVQPCKTGTRTAENSQLKCASSAGSAAVVLESEGRFCGQLNMSDGVLTCMPRAAGASTVYYVLTAVDCETLKVVDTLTMPRSFTPSTATYMGGSFAFTIKAGYDYGGGIANVGTYYPISGTSANASEATWLRLTRTPVLAPGTCAGWLFSKSGTRTVLVNRKKQRYFTVSAPGDALDWGDYQVCTGALNGSCIYLYATLSETEDGEEVRHTLIRKLTPVAIST